MLKDTLKYKQLAKTYEYSLEKQVNLSFLSK